MEGRQVSHYEILRLLGRGGMGEVWEAVDLHLDRRPVALKFISADLARDAESLARFEREASSAARLKHPNIATVHAFVREGALPFIDMELLTGGSLRDRMGGGPLAVSTALAIARDVAGGLAHAHRRGVVHRDIKPENLMFDDESRVRVADFGLSRATQASRLTMTGTTLGTAAYMAPESVRGEAGAAADVYALGVVLYEMLAGRPPFTGDQPLALMYSIANEAPVPIEARRPDIPKPVAELVARLLDKDAGARPDAAETARALAQITGSAPPAFDPVTEDHEVERLSKRDTVKLLALMPRLPRWRRILRVAVVIAASFGTIAVLLIVLVILPFSRARAHREAVSLNNRGVESLRSDSLDAARRWFEHAVARDGRYAEPRINLASLLRQGGERDRAASLLTEALRLSPDSSLQASAHSGLADIELDAANFEGAIENLRRATALAPQSDVYANNLGFALIRAGRYTDAWQALEPAVSKFPDRPALLKNAGLALVKLDRAAEALPLLDRAIRVAPEYAPAWGVRATARAEAGDRSRSRADWLKYTQLTEDTAEHESVRLELERIGGVLGAESGQREHPATALAPGIPKPGDFGSVPSIGGVAPVPPTPPSFDSRLAVPGDLTIGAVVLQKSNATGRGSCRKIALDLEAAVLQINLASYRTLARKEGGRLAVTFHDRQGRAVEPSPGSVTYDGKPLARVEQWCSDPDRATTGYLIPN